jgi:hypothetical protein
VSWSEGASLFLAGGGGVQIEIEVRCKEKNIELGRYLSYLMQNTIVIPVFKML